MGILIFVALIVLAAMFGVWSVLGWLLLLGIGIVIVCFYPWRGPSAAPVVPISRTARLPDLPRRSWRELLSSFREWLKPDATFTEVWESWKDAWKTKTFW